MDGQDFRPQGAPAPEAAPARGASERRQLGRVVSVSGSQVVAMIEEPKGGPGAAVAPALQIGALVKMTTPKSAVFGMVSGLSIPAPARGAGEPEVRIAELEVVGEALNGPGGALQPFQRGVSAFPGLGDPVFASSQEDLARVYARPAVATVRIGAIHQDRTLPAFVVTDDLLGKHFAVLGTTGTGKSCAVALILHALVAQNANAHVVVLDPHNEYAHAFGDIAELLDPDTLQLPYWLFTLDEIAEVVLGAEGRSAPAETTILSEFVQLAKHCHAGNADAVNFITADTPVPYAIEEIVRQIDEAMGRQQHASRETLAPFLRLKSRLLALQADRRFKFMMFDSVLVRDTMVQILARLFRVPVAGKPITIVNLAGVPSEILNVVVSVLCRMTFDMAQWSERPLPVLLVCEEAHRYAPQDSGLGFEPAKRALSRIAKEGRKYGVSLCVVSQRPSELATTVLTQCNTIFAMRMTSQKDQEFVDGAMWESTRGLMDSLPSLRNGEAIAVGEGVPVPMRLCFEELPEARRPKSGTASFSQAWQRDRESAGFLKEIVDRWRRQRR